MPTIIASAADIWRVQFNNSIRAGITCLGVDGTPLGGFLDTIDPHAATGATKVRVNVIEARVGQFMEDIGGTIQPPAPAPEKLPAGFRIAVSTLRRYLTGVISVNPGDIVCGNNGVMLGRVVVFDRQARTVDLKVSTQQEMANFMMHLGGQQWVRLETVHEAAGPTAPSSPAIPAPQQPSRGHAIHVKPKGWRNEGGNRVRTFLACIAGSWDGVTAHGHTWLDAVQQLKRQNLGWDLSGADVVFEQMEDPRGRPAEPTVYLPANIQVYRRPHMASDEFPWTAQWGGRMNLPAVEAIYADSPEQAVRSLTTKSVARNYVDSSFEPTWEIVEDEFGTPFPIEVQPCGTSGFRARPKGWSQWCAEGDTETGAVLDLQQKYPQYKFGQVERLPLTPASANLPRVSPQIIVTYDPASRAWLARQLGGVVTGFQGGSPEQAINSLCVHCNQVGTQYNAANIRIEVGSMVYVGKRENRLWDVSYPSSSLSSAATTIEAALNDYRVQRQGLPRVGSTGVVSPAAGAPFVMPTASGAIPSSWQRSSEIRYEVGVDSGQEIRTIIPGKAEPGPSRAKRRVSL